MKKLFLLFFATTLLYSCSNEMLFDTELVDDFAVTKSTTDTTYCFSANIYNFGYNMDMEYNEENGYITLQSYKEFGGTVTDIMPEVVSKPSWVDGCTVMNVYYRYYLVVVHVYSTPTQERTGIITLRQPGSNNILYAKIRQRDSINHVTISVNETFPNHYECIATAAYPVRKQIRCFVPYTVYNGAGELSSSAVMIIPEGQTTGSFEMDFNSSPLVYYHGNLSGCRLHEGSITGTDNFYTYSLVPYW